MPRRRPTIWLKLTAAACLAGGVLLVTMPTSACPMCSESVPEGDSAAGTDNGPSNTAKGYFWSILFMMAAPFTLAGGAGVVLYLTLRKADPVVNAGA